MKLKDQIEKVVRAMKCCLTGLSDIRSVLVILGPSPTRPKHVYEVHLRCQLTDVGDDTVEGRPKSPDLARKVLQSPYPPNNPLKSFLGFSFFSSH